MFFYLHSEYHFPSSALYSSQVFSHIFFPQVLLFRILYYTSSGRCCRISFYRRHSPVFRLQGRVERGIEVLKVIKRKLVKKKAQRDCFSQSSVETKWNSFETQSVVAHENLHVRIQGSIEVEVAKGSR